MSLHKHNVFLAQPPPPSVKVGEAFKPYMIAKFVEPPPGDDDHMEGEEALWGHASILDTRSGDEPDGYDEESRWVEGSRRHDPDSGLSYWKFQWKNLYFPQRGRFFVALQIIKPKQSEADWYYYRTGKASTKWIEVS